MVKIVLVTNILFLLMQHPSAFGVVKPDHSFAEELPEESMDTNQIIKYYGYPCETHDVVTKDGYILTVHRIPYGRQNALTKKGPVFLQHGLLDSSATWVVNLPTESLAFILSDRGYDVWLGNSRGNTYSNRHVNLTIRDSKYWDFSFDEMATYDLPACVNYVLNITNSPKLHYIGHSQGSMIAFAGFGINQYLSAKIKCFFALGPVATVGHIKGALKFLSSFGPEIKGMLKLFGVMEFLPNNWILKYFAKYICGEGPFTERLCGNFIFLMAGYDVTNLNYTRIPVYFTHTPAGTSVKNILHFIQMIKSGKFQMYDYGPEGNMKYYGQINPISYNLRAMKTPVALFTATNDWLADPWDVNQNLKPYLQNLIYQKNLATFNHMDFLWGIKAAVNVYKDILNIME